MSLKLHTAITLAADATAEKIFTFTPARRTKSLRIINRGSEAMDVGFDATVVTGSGIPFAINGEETLDELSQDVWAIGATAASSKIVMIEEFYGEDV